MRCTLIFLLFVISVMSVSSCRKDTLHFHTVQRLSSGTTARIDHIGYVGNGVYAGAGGETFNQSLVMRSADDGYTWSAGSYSQAPKEMYGMSIWPEGKIYLSGVDGDVLQSADSGKTYQFNRIDIWEPLVGGGYPVADTGIFITTVLQRQCTIIRVNKEYGIIDKHTYLFGLNNIYFAGNKVFIIGYGTVMVSTDRGNSWHFQDVQGDNFTAMDIHGDEIWMCGANGSIYHTTDAGDHWQRLRNGNDLTHPHYALRSLVFKDHSRGWAVGDDGKVIYTDDGGHHWAEYDKFTSSDLRSVLIAENGELLVAGDNGNLYRITP